MKMGLCFLEWYKPYFLQAQHLCGDLFINIFVYGTCRETFADQLG
jgi:hypothetical protein